MRTKSFLSLLTLLLFAFLGGGSIDGDQIQAIFIFIVVAFVLLVLYAVISGYIDRKNKEKRLQMIKDDEKDSSDFDRSTSIGDDQCKIYFDSQKKQVMIMRVTTEGITKKYVDNFDFPGQHLAQYIKGSYYVYEPETRRLLRGHHESYTVTDLKEIDDDNKNEICTLKPIAPSFNIFKTKNYNSFSGESHNFCVLTDEHYGFIVVAEEGKIERHFSYIKAEKLPQKTGSSSTITAKKAGNYMFIMDSFFKVLVIIGDEEHKVLSYFDIIEVSYNENGEQLFSKSTGRTVGGAIVGGVLMGGAGAIVGGLSGDTKQKKVVNSMDIKILLRDTKETSYTLHFMDFPSPLKTKEANDMSRYEEFLKNANKAKDLLSIIIDDARQSSVQTAPTSTQPIVAQPSSVADELTKLAKLKADGILTEEEFQAQKAKLLS